MANELERSVEQVIEATTQLNAKLETVMAEQRQLGQRVDALHTTQPTDREEIQRLIAAELTAARAVRPSTPVLLGDDGDGENARALGVQQIRQLVQTPLRAGSPRAELQRELQDLNDIIMLGSVLGVATPQARSRWDQLTRAAMDTQTATEGAEWVWPEWSAELIGRVDVQLRVAALFQNITMRAATRTYPRKSGRPSVFKAAENTESTGQTAVTASQFSTGNVVFTAKKLMGRTVVSRELTEDSIVDVLGEARQELADAFAWALEGLIINGQVSGTDDNIASSSDYRRTFDGLRDNVIKTGANAAWVDFATFTVEQFSTLLTKMDKYAIMPSELAWIASVNGWHRMRTLADANGNLVVLTLEKLGPAATLLRGQLGSLYDIPIIPSEHVSKTLDASGVLHGTSNKSQTLCVYRPGWRLATRRAVEAPQVLREQYAEYDQIGLQSSWRGDFQPIYDATTEPIVGIGYNQSVA